MQDNNDPFHLHTHDPNPNPPSADPTFLLATGRGTYTITVADLQQRPLHTVNACYIVSTGHGTSGPFAFGGVPLLSLLTDYAKGGALVEGEVVVLSGDGFGTRLSLRELHGATDRPPLLAYLIDGRPLTRADGLVRLIVPAERDDALRQVKWVARIELR